MKPLSDPRHPALRFAIILFGLIAIVVVIVVIAAGSGPGDRASDGLGPITLTKQEQRGRRLFSQHCGNCHTLKTANAVARVGPSLDMLRPPAPATLSAIRRGPGGMPADAVTGADADAVAAFVAAVTAH
jgi:mono/diheme cytochrome c family protein